MHLCGARLRSSTIIRNSGGCRCTLCREALARKGGRRAGLLASVRDTGDTKQKRPLEGVSSLQSLHHRLKSLPWSLWFGLGLEFSTSGGELWPAESLFRLHQLPESKPFLGRGAAGDCAATGSGVHWPSHDLSFLSVPAHCCNSSLAVEVEDALDRHIASLVGLRLVLLRAW